MSWYIILGYCKRMMGGHRSHWGHRCGWGAGEGGWVWSRVTGVIHRMNNLMIRSPSCGLDVRRIPVHQYNTWYASMEHWSIMFRFKHYWRANTIPMDTCCIWTDLLHNNLLTRDPTDFAKPPCLNTPSLMDPTAYLHMHYQNPLCSYDAPVATVITWCNQATRL